MVIDQYVSKRRGEIICQKTARDCRMEKTGIRMKVWEEN
jgi:hypothetical protein